MSVKEVAQKIVGLIGKGSLLGQLAMAVADELEAKQSLLPRDCVTPTKQWIDGVAEALNRLHNRTTKLEEDAKDSAAEDAIFDQCAAQMGIDQDGKQHEDVIRFGLKFYENSAAKEHSNTFGANYGAVAAALLWLLNRKKPAPSKLLGMEENLRKALAWYKMTPGVYNSVWKCKNGDIATMIQALLDGAVVAKSDVLGDITPKTLLSMFNWFKQCDNMGQELLVKRETIMLWRGAMEQALKALGINANAS